MMKDISRQGIDTPVPRKLERDTSQGISRLVEDDFEGLDVELLVGHISRPGFVVMGRRGYDGYPYEVVEALGNLFGNQKTLPVRWIEDREPAGRVSPGSISLIFSY